MCSLSKSAFCVQSSARILLHSLVLLIKEQFERSVSPWRYDRSLYKFLSCTAYCFLHNLRSQCLHLTIMRSFPCFGAFALFSAASATIASNGKTMPCGSEICFDGVYSDNPPNYWTVNKGDPAETFLWNRDFWMYWLSTRNTKDQEVTFEWLMLDVPGMDSNLFFTISQSITDF